MDRSGKRVAWQRAEERAHWEQLQRRRGKVLGELEKRSKREWSALYGRQDRQREHLVKDCRGVLGRLRAELEQRQRWERVSLGKAHSEAVRGIESKAGEFYRADLKGSEKRAREAARSDGLLLRYGSRPVDWYRLDELKHSVSEERLEQVREIDGEQAYEKMRRAVEKASQEKASQEKARLEWDRQETARQSRERRGAGTQRTGAGLWPQPLRRSARRGILGLGKGCGRIEPRLSRRELE